MSLFVSKKPLVQWLGEYGVSHKNASNKKIHYLCVPVIFLTITALLFHLSPIVLGVVAFGVLWFYLRLSIPLFIAMIVFFGLCVAISAFLPVGAWFWIGVFIVAWIGQFIGHKIEGAKPSFFEDLQFLLIGPAWVALSVIGKMPEKQTDAV